MRCLPELSLNTDIPFWVARGVLLERFDQDTARHVARLDAVLELSDDQVAGMTLQPVAEADRAALKLPEGVPGLLISKVAANTPAANCGLEPGDIILRINGAAPATHAAAVDAVLNQSRDGQATLTVRKGEVSRIVIMSLK